MGVKQGPGFGERGRFELTVRVMRGLRAAARERRSGGRTLPGRGRERADRQAARGRDGPRGRSPVNSNTTCHGSVSDRRWPSSIASRTALASAPRNSRWPATRVSRTTPGRSSYSIAAASDDAASGFSACVQSRRASSRIGPQAGNPRGDVERRAEHGALESPLPVPQRRELKVFLGTEVGEEPALGKPEPGGERSDAQTLEPDLAGKRERVVQDECSGAVAFFHVVENSTNVRPIATEEQAIS